jgi:hypothetical protein
MNKGLEEFFRDFRQVLLAGAEAREDFLEAEFALAATKELEDSGAIEGFEPCQYKAPRGMRVDGYWYNDDGVSIDLFITDFANRETLENLTKTDADALFKRLENFFAASAEKILFRELEETSLGYGLARDISERAASWTRVNFYLLSERRLSERVAGVDEKKYGAWLFNYNIWDITRLHRISTSRGAKEELVINFKEMFGHSIQCLPAHIDSNEYESFLMVMPGKVLAELYGRYGDRLLEQNVRCFLQARGKVNKGIRATILEDPSMFFAYNNGITATARAVKTAKNSEGIHISEITDLQVVNGGQTTASLFHTSRKDKAPLDKIFVQMKLSIVDSEKCEEVVPRISEYANTQNKVNAADFFSNHPFHVRMEEFSRRIWAPAVRGATRESKWFYERARGQYSDAQAKISATEKKRFLSEFPKRQVFSKTDLAKFLNVWDDSPVFVNLGSQKNFARFARRTGEEWEKNDARFNELFYRQAIARAIIFRALELAVSQEAWYNGGYRANIVAYAIAALSKLCTFANSSIDFEKIWRAQEVDVVLKSALLRSAVFVSAEIMAPPSGIANISEWCKKEGCWERILKKIPELKSALDPKFFSALIPLDDVREEMKDAAKNQRVDAGIALQREILEMGGERWQKILTAGMDRGFFTRKEADVVRIAARMPVSVPSEKQCKVLKDLLARAEEQGIPF